MSGEMDQKQVRLRIKCSLAIISQEEDLIPSIPSPNRGHFWVTW